MPVHSGNVLSPQRKGTIKMLLNKIQTIFDDLFRKTTPLLHNYINSAGTQSVPFMQCFQPI